MTGPSSAGLPEGAVAVVTGASRGIGEAVARDLAARGASVVLAARSVERIEAVAEELRAAGAAALAVPTDVTVIADLDRLLEETERAFGRLDVVVNNAGVLPSARRQERVELAEWEHAMMSNVTAAWYLATRAHRLLRRQGGVVINVSSTAGHYPSIGLGPYCVSKAAVLMLTRSLAIEWACDGIRVISISPGKVDTVLVRPILDWIETNEATLNPLGRVAAPSELGELIGFLASPASSYVTGCDIAFDGGELATAPR